MPSLPYTPLTKLVDDCMIATVRAVLALSALVVTYIDPSEPDQHVAFTYATLVLYTAYSLILYILARRQNFLLLLAIAHWVDLGWYGVLIGLSSGTNSIFFFFFFFAILVASFQGGFASGCRVTLAAVVLFTTISYALTPAGLAFELNRFLLRPVSLLGLGYMLACWGEAEIKLKRRLALLKDVSTLSNPCFGVEQTLSRIMQRLRAFYNADACLLVTADRATGEYSMRRSARHNPEGMVRKTPIPAELGCILLALPAAQGMVYHGAPRLRGWWRPARAAQALEAAPSADIAVPAQIGEILAAESFVTVPFRFHDEVVGRLYLASTRRRGFEDSDVDFLFHLLDHTIPLLDNVRLVNRLVSDAAEMERQRIARNLHDSVLQPCVGLRLGLAAAMGKFRLAGTNAGKEIEQVIKLSDAAVADLRRYINELRDGNAPMGGLLPALQGFAKQFSAATGIAVHVEAEGDMCLNDRLAAEVSQMVAEGLSNVRRHTYSTWATVSLACRDGHLSVQIENDGVADQSLPPFTPRSIAERAAAIGGQTRVERTDMGRTVVLIDIPL